MPEGDTITRAARSLHLALAGRVVTRFESPRLSHRPFPEGTTVTAVEARGKHCLVHFDDGRTLHTHMRMSGSWHLYRPGERWRKKPAAARVVLEVAPDGERGGWVAVCFAAPVVELVADEAEGAVGHLGPDLCRPDADVAEAVRRLGELVPADQEVGVSLLDQRVACGVGNVYKSEVLFACRLDPATPVGDLDPALRTRLLTTATRQLRANLGSVDRSTVAGGGLAVYGREGSPCRRCGTAVARLRQGEQARSTYWCPACQRRPGPSA